MNVPHNLLKQLAYSFDLSRYRLSTRCSKINITQENIASALGLSIAGKNLFPNIFCKSLLQLSTSMMEMNVDGKENRMKFKRTFILYIHMSFLLPKTVNKISPVHMLTILHEDAIRQRNWVAHMLKVNTSF
ncbi:hypothetical protein AHAS_Ahas07G0052500 [Arachis hypogaea]